MSAMQALQSVQFVEARGKRFAVISEEEWEALIEWLETLEDLEVVRKAFADLKAAGGDRKKAGWMKWNDVVKEIK
ncbi:MAG: hypothetical protein AB1750_18335 [Chloroflexota bacterium]